MAKKKAKPIGDLSIKQWSDVERAMGQLLLDTERSEGMDDRAVAVYVLNTIYGSEDEDGNLHEPPRGYTDDLIDGVMSIVPTRRRQMKQMGGA